MDQMGHRPPSRLDWTQHNGLRTQGKLWKLHLSHWGMVKKLGPTPPKYPKSMQILYLYAIYRWFLMMHLFKKGKTFWHPVLSSCCQVFAPIYRIPKCFCPRPLQGRCIIDRTLSLASHKKNSKKQDLLIELGCLNNFPVQYSLRYMSPSEAPSLEVWL